MMTGGVSPDRIFRCYSTVRSALLAERNRHGYWTGELSTSALSTATAIMALEMVRRDRVARHEAQLAPAFPGTPESEIDPSEHRAADPFGSPIERGLAWLAEHQNDDGGWGDTTKSLSNISTTMLARAAFHATDSEGDYEETFGRAAGYIDRVGGVEAVRARYGKDKTFSVPILTHCALAGLVEWRDVQPLPFELACLPARFYKTVRLPVVSYALPALIAIGQVRHHHRKPWNLFSWLIRTLAVRPSLARLERIQPENGGFLEAVPLTSFVTMSLAGMRQSEHPVARRGIQFILDSVRPDGSWPIDTNLATWVTTLSVNALGGDLPQDDHPPVRAWLLGQQYREVHPYTNADPGGWAWTDLPGGVPDADDTPGAILALLNLRREASPAEVPAAERQGLAAGVRWLLDLQNRDCGWPTFCRGWGALPFDRSAPDLSAHAIRALWTWLRHPAAHGADERLRQQAAHAVRSGFEYLTKTQRHDGSWLPLWFGNQFCPDESNPTYGTARVLAAYLETGRHQTAVARRGLQWLCDHQNEDGGWGGAAGTPSSTEETALATEVLVSAAPESEAARRGVAWLTDCVEEGSFRESTPLGFYFAKLWYFEKLYPLAFAAAALRQAHLVSASLCGRGASNQRQEPLQRQNTCD